jgi:hypothetical protein
VRAIGAGGEWYVGYRRSARWRLLRSLRRRLDGGRCRICGDARRLQTHHRSYSNRGAPGLLGFLAELRDCITLCDACHGRAHQK